MSKQAVNSAQQLAELVQQMGFLPFFKNEIPGFSIEEHTPAERWFSDKLDGPWEWKGPVARAGGCIYGKLFWGKAGFVSLDWLPDFANYRRDGYDFDARCDDDLVPKKDQNIYNTIAQHGNLLSKELKDICNYHKGGNKGFETIITRLQMQTYVCIADFEYMTDKNGHQYGWGVARYTTPEAQLGTNTVTAAYSRPPQESYRRMMAYLQALLPQATEKQIAALLK